LIDSFILFFDKGGQILKVVGFIKFCTILERAVKNVLKAKGKRRSWGVSQLFTFLNRLLTIFCCCCCVYQISSNQIRS